MTRTSYYRYLGTNGIIESPVHLEDIYYVPLVQLMADDKKILTNGNVRKYCVLCAREEVNNWKEIDA